MGVNSVPADMKSKFSFALMENVGFTSKRMKEKINLNKNRMEIEMPEEEMEETPTQLPYSVFFLDEKDTENVIFDPSQTDVEYSLRVLDAANLPKIVEKMTDPSYIKKSEFILV